VDLTYITRRGGWYLVSWKGSPEKSGGVSMNIGVHFFDLLQWIFGEVEKSEVHLRTPQKMAGLLHLQRARVRWFLSVDGDDLPNVHQQAGKFAYRSISVDGQEIEFSTSFRDLHSKVYQEILRGNGPRIRDARPAIECVYDINNANITDQPRNAHPLVHQTKVAGETYPRRAA
jgi:UDP-N-acetyl-2-amino-2-deoxyglucuronate dehydrogenase